MRELLIFEPTVKNYIWGNEYWTVSAHPHGDDIVRCGTYKGEHLSSLWADHRELFGNLQGESFPLLVKKIDSRDDLSIQVHPDNEYARVHENGSYGKTECWYVIDAKPGGTIIVGHNAKTREELKDMIYNGRWKELLKEFPVKKGDFFQIVPGTVHAIKNHTVIMEIQQNSDITYRLYDYDRVMASPEGGKPKPRPLHLEKSIDVITVPHKASEWNTAGEGQETGVHSASADTAGKAADVKSAAESRLVSCEYYTVDKYDIEGMREFSQDRPFEIVSVIGGEGDIDGTELREGDSLIVPFGYGSYRISGKVSVLITGV
ncbi:MAG TPA: mannose-6-phosphate isomerase [Lachnospiraceae bacterium]|nr:mannose-6-phosphate isomerase [Lachnospiraceae bacterium]